MKIVFLCVGKPHEAYVKMGVDDFSHRIQKYFTQEWMVLPPIKEAANLSITILKKKEADHILSKLHDQDFVVALEETGTIFTSKEVSNLLQHCAGSGSKRIVFLIGGAYGLDPMILKRANLQWSLSKLVFPHQLVRLILAEQVYRACTILKNEKYHHS